MKRQILVTGSSGFIGGHVVDALHKQGHHVLGLDQKPALRTDIEHHQGSILDRVLLDRLVQGCDYVFHIAGFSNINLVEDQPVETIELNVLSTVYLLDACRRAGRGQRPHFVYASSVYVFDRNGHLYTTGKAACERMIEDFERLYKIPYTILRYGTVYGSRSRKADVVYLFVKNALDGRPLEVHGNGDQKRNFIDVRDLAEANVRVVDNPKAVNKTLVAAHPESVSVIELANKVKAILGKDVVIRKTGQARDSDYSGLVDEMDIMRRVLDWSPEINIDQGIGDLAEELRSGVGL